ncbi:MAG: hypothetical protein J6Z38_07760 [Lachnospiraceae bacterium]|nr:hypothetical protein [Lachnospiraceae bacterium]
MNIYEQKLKIRSIDAGMDRRLRLSVLLSLIQESAIAHTEELGMGREKTLDKGLLWIVTMENIRIERLPEYDEEVTLRTWPGKTMHLLFPRYFELRDETGTPIVRASAIWSLIDEKTRGLIFPEKFGIVIEGQETGEEIPLPAPIRTGPCTEGRSFTVPYSFIDLNGHMNNTRYADLAEDCIHEETKTQRLKSLRLEFLREVRLNEELSLSWGHEDEKWFLTGASGKPCFRMELVFRPDA